MRSLFAAILLTVLLVLFSGCGEKPDEVTVTLAEGGPESNIFQFQVGLPYEFVVTNNTGTTRSWGVTPKVTVTMSLSSGGALGEPIVSPETFESAVVILDDIAPGETATVKYTFKVEDASPDDATMYSRSASSVDLLGISIVETDD